MKKENKTRIRILWVAFGAVLLLGAGSSVALFSQQVDVYSASTIVELIEDKCSTIDSFIGTFTYEYDDYSRSGYIYYEGPDKFALEYYNSGTEQDGIICDGNAIYLIFPAANVAIKEHLSEDGLDSPVLGWNIDRLQKEYTPVIPDEGYEVMYGGDLCYKIKFSPKVNTAGFREIYMVVSTEGLIKKITAESQMGVELVLAVSYSSFNTSIDDSEHFTFDPDENTQVYENMLIPAGLE